MQDQLGAYRSRGEGGGLTGRRENGPVFGGEQDGQTELPTQGLDGQQLCGREGPGLAPRMPAAPGDASDLRQAVRVRKGRAQVQLSLAVTKA